jgi:hypothetical protein
MKFLSLLFVEGGSESRKHLGGLVIVSLSFFVCSIYSGGRRRHPAYTDEPIGELTKTFTVNVKVGMEGDDGHGIWVKRVFVMANY